jgi:catechol 2,3-dioxygenase-like lactoylglutathione lyase family enzyme
LFHPTIAFRPPTLFDRREVMTMLGAGTLAPWTALAADQPFHLTGLDHVTLTVSDIDKSVAFYTRVFGSDVVKDKNGCYYVKLGPTYVAMAPRKKGQDSSAGNQMGLGVRNFQLSEVKRSLDRLGAQAREVKGQGVVVADSDGILTQLWTESSWNELGKTAQPVSTASSRAPLLHATAMNHLLLAVTDPEKAALFYAKILGPIAQRTAARPPLSGRIWFQAGTHRVGLAPLNQGMNTSGQKPGIDHFGVLAEFDRATLTQGLTEAGAKVLPQGEGPEAAGVDFLDVNGVRLQVMPPPAPRAKKA